MPDALVSHNSIAERGDPSAPAFVCSWTDGGPDAAWVHVAGELRLATVPQLVRTLREPQLQARLVVLDLREVEQIDAAAVHAIVNAGVRARQAGRRLVLVPGPTQVDQAFTATHTAGVRRLTGTSEAVEIGDPDPDEAPAKCSSNSPDETSLDRRQRGRGGSRS
jgi:anti-anti-sigma factor